MWAVTCIFTRAGYRRRGVSAALVRAALDFARARGAGALEGYPMLTAPGEEIAWGELHVGSRSIFGICGGRASDAAACRDAGGILSVGCVTIGEVGASSLTHPLPQGERVSKSRRSAEWIGGSAP